MDEKRFPRSEAEMLRQGKDKQNRRKYGDTRWLARDQIYPNITLPTRDIGELPRNYMLKVLVLNQPASHEQLWSSIVDRSDAPFDSMEHLVLTLRMALEQNWVYKEKNQTDGEYYYYVHRTKTQEVQEMVQADRKQLQDEAEEKVVADSKEVARMRAEQEEALDNKIRQLQNTLFANLVKIKEFDPEWVDNLPCTTQSGAIDFLWHAREGRRSTTAAAGEE